MAKKFSAYIKSGDNTFSPADNVSAVKKLDNGLYNINRDPYGVYTCIKKDINTKEILTLPEPQSEEVMKQIQTFYKQKEEFKKWKFNHKRGILLYGVPGGGKTSLISSIIDYACNEIDGVAFYIPSVDVFGVYRDFISTNFRVIEPDRAIIIIIEDIDSYFNGAYASYETGLLNTIDGVENKDNVLYLATTNYPEMLPDRIYNRPGRFDLKIEIKAPSAKSREFYLTNKILPDFLKTIDIKKWVKDTDGMNIAQISELVKSYFLLNLDYEEVVTSLKNKKIPSSSSQGREIMGFKKKAEEAKKILGF